MIATAPTKSVRAFSVGHASPAPDLAYFRQHYPETVASLGALPRREEWLRGIWELETRWRKAWETRGGRSDIAEVVVRGAPPAGREAEAEFDAIYAGGAAGLLHASALALAHGRRVLALCAGEFSEGDEVVVDAENGALVIGRKNGVAQPVSGENPKADSGPHKRA